MKLLRHGPVGQEMPALLHDDGTIRDLAGQVPDFAGAGISLAALDHIRALDPETLAVVPDPDRIGPCLASVPNFFCIGLNYAQHAAEAGMAEPKQPILFSKATSSLSGPNDPILIPPGSTKTDWEVELGVVIGAPTYQVTEDRALSHVAGYVTVNDVSERSFQLDHGGQWIKGKSAPSFGPIGPHFVTADAVPDPQALELSLRLNGEVVQASSTADMIFSVAEIIAHLSRYMALQPGDLIATGTPSGVGMGMKPPRYLTPGDVVEAEVHGLGAQRQVATQT